MEIQTIAIEKALRLLESIGAQFHVKLDDKEWGEAIPAKRVKKAARYPFGSVTAHIKPYLSDVKVNDAVAVPFGEFDPNAVRSTISGYLSAKWGNGSYIIHNPENQVGVLRLS